MYYIVWNEPLLLTSHTAVVLVRDSGGVSGELRGAAEPAERSGRVAAGRVAGQVARHTHRRPRVAIVPVQVRARRRV